MSELNLLLGSVILVVLGGGLVIQMVIARRGLPEDQRRGVGIGRLAIGITLASTGLGLAFLALISAYAEALR